MDTDEKREWQRQYLAQWCSGPVNVRGHLVACDLPAGHEGSCMAEKRTVDKHHARGSRACTDAGCGVWRRV